MIVIHAYMKVKPEYRNEFLERVKELIIYSQAEEGNISYQLYEEVNSTNHFVMIEKWEDAGAIEYHFESPHFIRFDNIAIDLMQEPFQVEKYEVTTKLV